MAIIEVGGTVGDIESLPFLEAIRQLKLEAGSENALSVHVTLVPHIPTAGELKTKPTQHSVREMREIGIQPDILVCRCDRPIPRGLKEKIALFSNVAVDSVISAVDVGCIYELPLVLHAEGLDGQVAERLNIWSRQAELSAWKRIVETFKKPPTVRCDWCGRSVLTEGQLQSLHESLVHGCLANDWRCSSITRLEQIERAPPRSSPWTHLGAGGSAIASSRARSPPRYDPRTTCRSSALSRMQLA